MGWQSHAACRGEDTKQFFPDAGKGLIQSIRDSINVCRTCPVRLACLKHALDHGEEYGVWGGLSEKERRRVAVRYRKNGGNLNDALVG